MARIEIRSEVAGQGGEPLERLRVVHARAGVKLDADQQLRVLTPRELGGPLPVGSGDVLPLSLADAGEVRQPATRVEVGRVIARRAGRTTGHRYHTVDAEGGREPHGVAQLLVVTARDRGVRIERIAGDIERRDGKAPVFDSGRPFTPGRVVAQKARGVAVRRGREAADADLERVHLWRRRRQQRQDVVERPIDERFQDHTEPHGRPNVPCGRAV